VQNFRNLRVWQKAHALAVRVKDITEPLVRRDRTGVVSQARRAALSIPSNIAEGCNRLTDRDFARFLQIAIASASELEYQLQFAIDTRVLKRRDAEQLLVRVVEVRRMLFGLLKRLRGDGDSNQQ
jgi:four helix bundle protein